MARQLALIDTPPDWRLDEQTREIGRRGVAQAKAALAAADRPVPSSQDRRPARHRPAA